MEGILEEFEARLFVNSILDTIINDITKADIKAKDKIDSTTDSLIDHVEQPQIQKEVVEDHSNSQDEAESSLKNLNDNLIEPENVLKEGKELIGKCKEFYKDHKIEEAYKIYKKLDLIPENLNKDDLGVLRELMSKEEATFGEIEREYAYLNKILEELVSADKKDWKTDQIDDKTKISYKKGSNELLTIRMEAEIDVPLLHLISMINEVELWKLWNPLMNQTAEVASIHRGARVYYVEYGLPYPLSNREIHLYGVGVNRLYENGTIIIMAKSVDDDEEFFKKHKIKKYEHKGAVNIDVHVGGFEITPIGRYKCLLKGVTNINPKFDWVPKNIMNWVLKKGTKQMVDKIATGAMNFKGSAWEKEIKSERKREFYEWLADQLEMYHNKQESDEMGIKVEEEK